MENGISHLYIVTVGDRHVSVSIGPVRRVAVKRNSFRTRKLNSWLFLDDSTTFVHLKLVSPAYLKSGTAMRAALKYITGVRPPSRREKKWRENQFDIRTCNLLSGLIWRRLDRGKRSDWRSGRERNREIERVSMCRPILYFWKNKNKNGRRKRPLRLDRLGWWCAVHYPGAHQRCVCVWVRVICHLYSYLASCY